MNEFKLNPTIPSTLITRLYKRSGMILSELFDQLTTKRAERSCIHLLPGLPAELGGIKFIKVIQASAVI